MTNPLDYAKRESFTQATELSIDEVRVVSGTLFEATGQEVLQGLEGRGAGDDVDIGSASRR
jgi:hypothetical protein